MIYCPQLQEALLPQTDRATRSVSRNLVNCCTTVGTSCTAYPQQIETELECCYGRPTCDKLCRSIHNASTTVGVIHKLDRRRVLLTRRSTCRGDIFQLQSLGLGGSVAEWLVCWTQAQKGLGSNRSRDAVG